MFVLKRTFEDVFGDSREQTAVVSSGRLGELPIGPGEHAEESKVYRYRDI